MNSQQRRYNPSLAAQMSKQGKAYLSRIRKMEPYERLVYWIKERQRIHMLRYPKGYTAYSIKLGGGSTREELVDAGYYTPPPWTEDPIFNTIFFCNAYRENDKVTSYLRRHFRFPYRDKPCVLLGTILLRWYNHIPTMSLLISRGVARRWDRSKYEDLLVPLRSMGVQLFGGAYIVRPIVDGKLNARKVESIGELLDRLHNDKYLYPSLCSNTMEYAFEKLCSYSGMGKFYVYQFLADLAYTHILDNAKDWFTWGYCGPGTSRGLVRLRHKSGVLTADDLPRRMPRPRGAYEQLSKLQEQVNKDICGSNQPPVLTVRHGGEVFNYVPLHMRDLANCLCEYDKYERALFNERSIKRPYHPH